ncbi:hypothetical protein [Methylobacterium isbiliense]|nr:hypothetical protein [Methylobacterium isbiliense]MDN3626967.1 hypothetical protein [Methylobacterium isbiliense]
MPPSSTRGVLVKTGTLIDAAGIRSAPPSDEETHQVGTGGAGGAVPA